MPYDPNYPLHLQRQDWTCSIRSLQMALESAGYAAEIGWLQDEMVDHGIVNSDVGLTAGDGRLLVPFINARWPNAKARRIANASFDDVLALAGRQPVMLGGHGWGGAGHWVTVRRAEGDRIILGNPGGTGPVFGQQSLTREDWDRIANAWSVVTFDGAGRPDEPRGPEVVPEPEAAKFPFVLGFAELAKRLGHEVIGDALEAEHPAERDGHGINHQLTTKGELVYWIDQNRAEFYPTV